MRHSRIFLHGFYCQEMLCCCICVEKAVNFYIFPGLYALLAHILFPGLDSWPSASQLPAPSFPMKARAIHCMSTWPGQRGELGPQAKHQEINVGLSRVGMQALELDISLRMLFTSTAKNSSFAGGEQVNMKELPVPWKGEVGRSALCSSSSEPTHISLRCDKRTWIGSTNGGAEWLKQYFRAGWEKSQNHLFN